jgi:hypothetical protein
MYTVSALNNQTSLGVRVLRQIAFGLVFLGLAACGSTPEPPTRELQAAEQAIVNAEQARVVDYAASDFDQARRKLAAANEAVRDREMELAQRLAVESQVSAELASAKTEMIKAKAVNDQLQDNIDALTRETERNSGAR